MEVIAVIDVTLFQLCVPIGTEFSLDIYRLCKAWQIESKASKRPLPLVVIAQICKYGTTLSDACM